LGDELSLTSSAMLVYPQAQARASVLHDFHVSEFPKMLLKGKTPKGIAVDITVW
jgi:hypothetical protein